MTVEFEFQFDFFKRSIGTNPRNGATVLTLLAYGCYAISEEPSISELETCATTADGYASVDVYFTDEAEVPNYKVSYLDRDAGQLECFVDYPMRMLDWFNGMISAAERRKEVLNLTMYVCVPASLHISKRKQAALECLTKSAFTKPGVSTGPQYVFPQPDEVENDR